MTLKEIREMLQLMEEHGLSELEIEREGMKIRLKKGGAGGAPQMTIEHLPPTTAPVPAGAPAAPAAPAAKRLTINSPMVGTFYRAPAPDAPPFTDAGQHVEEGQVVCIIEAMKLMNEIKSDVRGTVVEVLATNGDPIEFGQPLFALEPL